MVSCASFYALNSPKIFCGPGPAGELTALPRLPSWIMEKGGERGDGRVGGGEKGLKDGEKGEGWEGKKAEGREGKGKGGGRGIPLRMEILAAALI